MNLRLLLVPMMLIASTTHPMGWLQNQAAKVSRYVPARQTIQASVAHGAQLASGAAQGVAKVVSDKAAQAMSTVGQQAVNAVAKGAQYVPSKQAINAGLAHGAQVAQQASAQVLAYVPSKDAVQKGIEQAYSVAQNHPVAAAAAVATPVALIGAKKLYNRYRRASNENVMVPVAVPEIELVQESPAPRKPKTALIQELETVLRQREAAQEVVPAVIAQAQEDISVTRPKKVKKNVSWNPVLESKKTFSSTEPIESPIADAQALKEDASIIAGQPAIVLPAVAPFVQEEQVMAFGLPFTIEKEESVVEEVKQAPIAPQANVLPVPAQEIKTLDIKDVSFDPANVSAQLRKAIVDRSREQIVALLKDLSSQDRFSVLFDEKENGKCAFEIALATENEEIVALVQLYSTFLHEIVNELHTINLAIKELPKKAIQLRRAPNAAAAIKALDSQKQTLEDRKGKLEGKIHTILGSLSFSLRYQLLRGIKDINGRSVIDFTLHLNDNLIFKLFIAYTAAGHVA